MNYNFSEIEPKWQERWEKKNIYKVDIDESKEKYYVLDMFPYPSGAGLHVGHPLGYIASDIFSRYKRLKGFNVLHPMGFDAFGLPAEQYAIQTGQHPAKTTEQNIKKYKEQLKKIGLSYDWDREVRTCDSNYYKWTQWIFLQLFGSWYNKQKDKAEYIDTLISEFEKNGNGAVDAETTYKETFSAGEWKSYSEEEKQKVLLHYRLAYLDYAEVNWCPALGTVLANDEVKDGFSERGGHPVYKKRMRQWFLRITAYAHRLLGDLNAIEWSESLTEMQKNWIGKSEGAEVDFPIKGQSEALQIYTTRPDTIFGATYMVLAPEHELVQKITTKEYRQEVENYLEYVQSRSERERLSEVNKITGVFTGAYAVNPLNNEKLPIWIGEYVLGGYGTGAIMAVPAHDARDYAFAKFFDLPIKEVIQGGDISKEAYEAKSGRIINSDFINGMKVREAIQAVIEKVEAQGIGRRKINYRLRDAGFSRQRYWGEPFPIIYKNEIPYAVSEPELPVELPDMDDFAPSGEPESPLARLNDWVNIDENTKRETNTMPATAGSSWYYLRYMDPHNPEKFVSEKAEQYWQNVNLYVGGTEHATGHLMYARFWHKVLHDLGYVTTIEPFQKLINQGMIQGRSAIMHRIKNSNKFVSLGLSNQYETVPIRVDVNLVENDVLDIEQVKAWRAEFADAEFILEDGKFICDYEIEKMSKRWHNVVNPDDVIKQYGTDTFRIYEMFLGPIEQHKPWDTKGIDGISRFLNRFWRLFFENEQFKVSDEKPEEEELKSLHKTLQKVTEDIESFSFNTAISALMVCVNDLTKIKCNKKAILEPLVIALSPFAPHIAEELWAKLGHESSVVADVQFPEYNEEYIKEDVFEYPVAINGKTRTKIKFAVDAPKEEIEREVLGAEALSKWLEGTTPKRVIVVPNRMINIVT